MDLGLADLVDKVGLQTGLYGPPAPEGALDRIGCYLLVICCYRLAFRDMRLSVCMSVEQLLFLLGGCS